MTPKERFFLGGVGALLPVLASVVTLDVAAYLSNSLSWPQMVGILIRYTILFLLGGFITYLHDDENKPFKLVELGVAAPALITSLVAGHAATAQPSQGERTKASNSFSIISSAHAESVVNDNNILVASVFGGLLQGLTGSVYSTSKVKVESNNIKYERLKSNAEKLNSITITPDNYIYEVKASARATGNNTSSGPEYRFTIFINSTKETLATIKQVKYDFLHSSFKNKHVTSEDREDHFSYSYTGWGCLTSVDVTVELSNGTSKSLDFNMCSSLGPEWKD